LWSSAWRAITRTRSRVSGWLTSDSAVSMMRRRWRSVTLQRSARGWTRNSALWRPAASASSSKSSTNEGGRQTSVDSTVARASSTATSSTLALSSSVAQRSTSGIGIGGPMCSSPPATSGRTN
jgi:hypothetical protein